MSRFVGFGLLTAGVAGRTLFESARSLSRGELPKPDELLLTPLNILKISDELARMRGAALKLGQLISMDAGDVLPRELADVMARLRADADHMPVSQLNTVMADNLGVEWIANFDKFDLRPIAAASIGQVHKARTTDGRDLAIKVQYPGVEQSIDSDVDSVVSLFRLTGLMPDLASLAPLINEAKTQLHEEADYAREADYIRKFGTLVSDDKRFVVPEVQDEFSTRKILAMTFVEGQSIEAVESADQESKDEIFERLIRLALNELFRFGFVQTDPNFANYTYDPDSRRIGLLDFGAMREFSPDVVERYRRFLRAGLEGDRKGLQQSAKELGLYSNDTLPHHRNTIERMIPFVFGAIRRDRFFRFGAESLMREIRSMGMELALDRSFTEVPPIDVIYLQRKAVGLFLLGRRLRASIPLRDILCEHT